MSKIGNYNLGEIERRDHLIQELAEALRKMTEAFAPDHESDFAEYELDHFKKARAALAKTE